MGINEGSTLRIVNLLQLCGTHSNLRRFSHLCVFLPNIAAHSGFFAYALQDTTVHVLISNNVEHYMESVFEGSKLTKIRQTE